MEVRIFNFLSMLFRNKDFISQESPILADVENISLSFKICSILIIFGACTISQKLSKFVFKRGEYINLPKIVEIHKFLVNLTTL